MRIEPLRRCGLECEQDLARFLGLQFDGLAGGLHGRPAHPHFVVTGGQLEVERSSADETGVNPDLSVVRGGAKFNLAGGCPRARLEKLAVRCSGGVTHEDVRLLGICL